MPTDFPLGLGRPADRPAHHRGRFAPGALLVCYTDGLVERRAELIDEGLERLRAAVAPAPAEEVCAALMLARSGAAPTDDIALLAIRRPGGRARPGPRTCCSRGLRRGGVPSLRRRVYAVADRYGMAGDDADDFVTAVNEVMTNAVRHGGGGGELRLWGDDVLVCEVSDRGRASRPTPT